VPEHGVGDDHIVGTGDGPGIGAIADPRLDGETPPPCQLAESADGLLGDVHRLDVEAVPREEDRVATVARTDVEGAPRGSALSHKLHERGVGPESKERSGALIRPVV